jgi:hypothetical protein
MCSLSSTSMPGQDRSRQTTTGLNDCQEMRKKRMIAIGVVKAMISVRPTGDQAKRTQSRWFFLDGAQSEPTQRHQLSNIALALRVREKQAQDFGPHFWKQKIQRL